MPLIHTTMERYYWLAVTADKYELPLAVALTAEELGKMRGLDKSTIKSAVRRGNTGKNTGIRYVKVRMDNGIHQEG